MTEHLPDCFLSEPWNATTNPQLCICAQLRACEARVFVDRTDHWNAALDAARDAVAALMPADYEMNWCAAIDAIDALKGENA